MARRSGAWIAKRRRAADLTQSELASKLGVAVPTISNWETGKTKPRREQLDKLRALFPSGKRRRSSAFAKRLREQRTQAELSQRELANQLGVSVATVSGWERGTVTPNEESRGKVEAYFSGPPAEFALAEWLREQRTRKGMSQQQVAEKAGLSAQTMSNIETGKIANPSERTLRNLERVFGERVPGKTIQQIDRAATVEGLGSKFTDFNPHDKDDLPGVPGVYALYDISERPIYVGQGGNIGKRIRDHEEKFWFKSPIVESASYVQINDPKLRGQIESILIRFLKSNAVINRKESFATEHSSVVPARKRGVRPPISDPRELAVQA